jgi:hypothetical protein
MLDYEAQKITADEGAAIIKNHYGHPDISPAKLEQFKGDITALRALQLAYNPI